MTCYIRPRWPSYDYEALLVKIRLTLHFEPVRAIASCFILYFLFALIKHNCLGEKTSYLNHSAIAFFFFSSLGINLRKTGRSCSNEISISTLEQNTLEPISWYTFMIRCVGLHFAFLFSFASTPLYEVGFLHRLFAFYLHPKWSEKSVFVLFEFFVLIFSKKGRGMGERERARERKDRWRARAV